jgi:hypothetical protein
MTWVRTHLALLGAALVAFFAIWAASRQKELAQKWQQKAVEIETGAVIKGVANAEAASTQAKLHESRAAEIKAVAEKKVGEKNATTADILAGWS